MAPTRKLLFTLITLLSISFTSKAQKFGFDQVLKQAPDEVTAFCLPNNEFNVATLQKEGIHIKFKTNNWIFISASPRWINEHKMNGTISDFYFETVPPVALADSARVWHLVNEVHSGLAPLESAYTGKGVIVGVVDQGLDFTHPDFLDSNGNTRVLRYWDHTMVSGPNTPMPYGYGQLWDSTAINAGTCTSTENATAHGTSVTGMAVGDGSANGSNMGIAPDANIVVVESNFNLSNWTLTIADAVDYIFKVADTLGMPAVVNLSLGSYFGSHDGNDPAAELMEALLDEKPGRIVVGAAGNSGAQLPYHQQGNVTADTNFVWFEDNPSAALGATTIFFDAWSDQADATFDFAIGADAPSNYSFRGRTGFHGAMSSIGTTIYDTIWNGANRIATIEAYTEIVGPNYHLQVVIDMDTTNYYYRFETTGSGKYDLWSGKWVGYNDMVTTLPTVGQMPDIAFYVLPDNEQTIVSSWNCSEKVISVGNFRNRLGHIDNNGNPYVNAATPPGEISPNSSFGPNRHNLTKPDVSAAGDVSLSAGPLWVLGNPAYNSLIDSGGWHVRNGGTSMASPVVAGIAALYLERCRYATYDQFKTDLINTVYTDAYTGTVPNNTYGFGKPDAYALLQELTLETQPTITYNSATTILSSGSNQYQWYVDGAEILSETNQEHTPIAPYGSYTVMTINSDGCYNISDPLVITAGIAENEIELTIAPNPASDEIEIIYNGSIKKIICTDMSGRSVHLMIGEDKKVQLSQLSAGTYTLQIITNEGIFNTKLIRL